MRGSGSPPAATASRSDHAPAQKTAKRARDSPAAWRSRMPRGCGSTASTGQPVTTSPPAARTSSAKAPAIAWKSTTAVCGECSASTPRTCGSISAISLAGDPAQALDAVGDAAALELVELRPLRLRDRDDQLAGAAGRQPARLAVVEELARALGAEARLERAGGVVDARVQDAGVVPGLMEARDRLALEHRDGAVGLPRQQLARHREADDAGADDDDVGLFARRGQGRPTVAADPTTPLDTVDPGMPEAAQDPRIDELLAGLNPPQRDAVTHGEGPLLILAGAGSGKTRVLTHRIAYLMRTGQARADEILAITFTNKAAQEMRERVELLVGRATRAMWVMTFHSACARMLRADAHRLGYTRQFTIYDAADQRRLLKRCLDDLDIDSKRFTPRAMQSQISDAKNKLRSAEDYRQLVGSYFEQTVADVYEQYERELHRMNAMDFDDLLVRSVNLLELFQEVRDRYATAFRWILVDEYQDTNHAQYRWLQLLASEHRNLAVVGDDDQCLVEGTPITMGDGSVKPIEEVQPGDEVLSSYGSGDFRPARVTDTSSLASGGGARRSRPRGAAASSSTAEHMHFAGFKRGHTPPMQLTYLMWRRDKGFRVGTTKVLGPRRRKFPVSRGRPAGDAGERRRGVDRLDARHRARGAATGGTAVAALRHSRRCRSTPAEREGARTASSATRGAIDRVFSSLDTERGRPRAAARRTA